MLVRVRNVGEGPLLLAPLRSKGACIFLLIETQRCLRLHKELGLRLIFIKNLVSRGFVGDCGPSGLARLLDLMPEHIMVRAEGATHAWHVVVQLLLAISCPLLCQ